MTSPHPIFVLARQTWLEAWHARLPVMLITLLVAGLAMQWFVGAISLIEFESSGLAVTAPLVRLAAVALVASMSVSVIAREVTDSRIELTLSAPIERPIWVIGRLAGTTLIALVSSIAATGAVAGHVAPAALLLWWVSLLAELVLIGALSVCVAVALRAYALSLLALGLLYLTSRLIGTIHQLASSDLPGLAGLTSWDAALWLTGALALMLPRLELYAPSVWLLNDVAPQEAISQLALGASQFVIYFALLTAACCIDFKRDID